MKLRIGDRLRIWVGKRYLDFAESGNRIGDVIIPMLQRVGIGRRIIPTLRRIRVEQRSEAEDARRSSKPPLGTEIDYLYFRLIEIYNLEEERQLWESIDRQLPGIEEHPFYRDIVEKLRKSTGTVHGGAGVTLGVILRDAANSNRYTIPTWVRPELPKEVDRVFVKVHRVLPSVAAVVLDVYLNQKATERIVQLQDTLYLSTVRFKQILPRGHIGGGYSKTNSYSELTQGVLSWLDNLRSQVETLLRPLLSGYFRRRVSETESHLPSIEVYALRGAPEEQKPARNWMNDIREWCKYSEPTRRKPGAFEMWAKRTSGWCSFLGFNFYPDLYRNDNLIHMASLESADGRPTVDRLVILWEPYLRTLDPSFGSGPDRERIASHTGSALDALTPYIIVHELVRTIRQDVEKLRQNAFTRMKFGWFRRGRLSSLFKVGTALHQQSVLLDRTQMEFEQQKALMIRNLELYVGELKNAEVTDENLNDLMLESITREMEVAKNHLGITRTSFADYLSFRLQRRMLWLTWAVFTATLVGVAAVWETPKTWLGQLFKLIGELLKLMVNFLLTIMT